MKIIILKILFLFLLIYLYIKKFKLLIKFIIIDNYFKRDNNYFLKYFFNLKNKKSIKKYLINNNYFKKDIIINLSKKNKKTINEIFLSLTCRFGNCIIYLNKFIFYCEILGCNTIFLNKNSFWFIKNNNLLKNNITIKLFNIRQSNKYFKFKFSFNNLLKIKPEIRINLLNPEINHLK